MITHNMYENLKNLTCLINTINHNHMFISYIFIYTYIFRPATPDINTAKIRAMENIAKEIAHLKQEIPQNVPMQEQEHKPVESPNWSKYERLPTYRVSVENSARAGFNGVRNRQRNRRSKASTKCHYCQSNSHLIMDCPDRILDMSARTSVLVSTSTSEANPKSISPPDQSSQDEVAGTILDPVTGILIKF